jgi:hypothetical protein
MGLDVGRNRQSVIVRCRCRECEQPPPHPENVWYWQSSRFAAPSIRTNEQRFRLKAVGKWNNYAETSFHLVLTSLAVRIDGGV